MMENSLIQISIRILLYYEEVEFTREQVLMRKFFDPNFNSGVITSTREQ